MRIRDAISIAANGEPHVVPLGVADDPRPGEGVLLGRGVVEADLPSRYHVSPFFDSA